MTTRFPKPRSTATCTRRTRRRKVFPQHNATKVHGGEAVNEREGGSGGSYLTPCWSNIARITGHQPALAEVHTRSSLGHCFPYTRRSSWLTGGHSLQVLLPCASRRVGIRYPSSIASVTAFSSERARPASQAAWKAAGSSAGRAAARARS